MPPHRRFWRSAMVTLAMEGNDGWQARHITTLAPKGAFAQIRERTGATQRTSAAPTAMPASMR